MILKTCENIELKLYVIFNGCYVMYDSTYSGLFNVRGVDTHGSRVDLQLTFLGLITNNSSFKVDTISSILPSKRTHRNFVSQT